MIELALLRFMRPEVVGTPHRSPPDSTDSNSGSSTWRPDRRARRCPRPERHPAPIAAQPRACLPIGRHSTGHRAAEGRGLARPIDGLTIENGSKRCGPSDSSGPRGPHATSLGVLPRGLPRQRLGSPRSCSTSGRPSRSISPQLNGRLPRSDVVEAKAADLLGGAVRVELPTRRRRWRARAPPRSCRTRIRSPRRPNTIRSVSLPSSSGANWSPRVPGEEGCPRRRRADSRWAVPRPPR